jgi:fluoride ion exporter CrcB/FEX
MKKQDKAFIIAVVSLTIGAFTGFSTHIYPEHFLAETEQGLMVYHGVGIPVVSLIVGVLAIVYIMYGWIKSKSKDKDEDKDKE